MTGSLLLVLLAAVLMSRFDATTPLAVVSAVGVLGGVPIAVGVVASTMTALGEFDPSEAGVAAGVFNALRQVGSALGVAIPAAAFDLALAGGGGEPAGSVAAFASRAVVFAVMLVLVWALLRRAPRTAPVAAAGQAPAPAAGGAGGEPRQPEPAPAPADGA